MSEDILQAKIYKWYHNNFCTKLNKVPHSIFAVPNGGLRSKAEAMKFKATGLVSGVSDLIIVQPNRVLFVELKLENGRQSKTQIAFEKTVKNLGHQYYVVRSLEEFKKIIEST